MENLQFEAEFLTWDQASQNSFTFACHLTSTIGIRVSWDDVALSLDSIKRCLMMIIAFIITLGEIMY